MHQMILLLSNWLSSKRYSCTVFSITVVLAASSPRKLSIADIPILLQSLAVDNALLYVLPETHFLAILNKSFCSKPTLYPGFEVSDRETVCEFFVLDSF